MIVKYYDKDLDLNTGDVILYWRKTTPLHNPMTLLSGAIRLVTRSHWNHVAIVISIWGKPFIMEAVAGGVVCHPLEDHLTRYASEVLIRRSITPVVEDQYATKAISKMGKPYALDVLFFIQLWFQLSGKWIGKTQSNAENSFVCSQFAAWTHNLPLWWEYTAKTFAASPLFTDVFTSETTRYK